MCGILAYIGKENFSSKKIRQTLSLMKNRGPDNQKCLRLNFHKKKNFTIPLKIKNYRLKK